MATLTTNANTCTYTYTAQGDGTYYIPANNDDWNTGTVTIPNVNYYPIQKEYISIPISTDDKKIKKLEKDLAESQERIKQLEKKLNDFIDNPDRVKNIRKIDPFEEEIWDE